MKHVRFPDLVSVGTYLTISSNLKNPVPVEFPNLEEISNGSINYYGMASMNFPKTAQGQCQFYNLHGLHFRKRGYYDGG